MIDLHEHHARGRLTRRPSICFQELFYGPYFCQVQDATCLRLRRSRAGRSDDAALHGLAAELNMVMILPVYEMEQEGVL